MTILTEMTGNIFDSTADALGHGVNCQGVMGAGIAKLFRDRYSAGYFHAYQIACETGGLRPGECQVVAVGQPGEPQSWAFNIASQDWPGADARLEWLRSGLNAALRAAETRGVRTLALPQIGCGIGGLRWDYVLPILREGAESGAVDIEAWTFA